MKYPYPLLLLLLCYLLSAAGLSAQTKITGTVRAKSGEVLPGVNLIIAGTYDGGSTDLKGRFSFTTQEKGSHILQVSMIGYEKFTLPVSLGPRPLTVDIRLAEKSNLLNTVQVSVGSFEAGDAKKGLMLTSLDIATTAGAQADIFGALQTLPGTQPAGSATGLFVRGGEASEAKTWFDGMLIKNPYFSDLPDIASRGRFSPFMFKGTNFSTGAYSAEFGQGLSSALQLESKDLPEKSSTDLSVMIVGLGLSRTQLFKKSALTLGYSYINLHPAFYLVPQNAHWTEPPVSQDGQIQYKLKTSASGMLKIYADYSYSKVGLSLPDLNDTVKKNRSSFPLILTNSTRNLYTNASYQTYLTTGWKISTGISYSSDNTQGNFARQITFSTLQRLGQLRLVSTHYFGNLSSFKWGIQDFTEKYQRGYDSVRYGYTDNLMAGFAEGNLFFTRQLALRLGARLEHSTWQHLTWLSPRASLSYRLDRKSQVAAAFGTFNQQPEEVFLLRDKNLESEKAAHYLLNYQYMANDQILRIETYYKKYNSLVKAVSPFSVLEYNNGYAYGSPLEAGYSGLLNNSGYGYARGVDFFFRDRHTIRGVDYWISYSYLDSKRDYKFFPGLATPAFAGKNTLNLVYKQFITPLHTQLSGTFTYASGKAYYDPASPVFMSSRTPDYKNLSISASYLTSIFKSFSVIFISLGNVPGFKNIYGYHYADNGLSRTAILPPSLRTFFIGMFLTFGDARPLD